MHARACVRVRECFRIMCDEGSEDVLGCVMRIVKMLVVGVSVGCDR